MIDNDTDDPDYYEDTGFIWEYYDQNWVRFLAYIEDRFESMRDLGSPRYMYKPGDKDLAGLEERVKSTNPPKNGATNHVYFSDMIDRQIYTGAGRRVRRIIDGEVSFK